MDNYHALTSPFASAPYAYHETGSQLESSASTSPMETPYELSYDLDPGFEPVDGSGESGSPSEASQQQAQKPKRKRENRYKNAPPSVLSRRRAQNRASQRAYRERKDQRIKDLEVLLTEAQQRNDVLSQAYGALQAEYLRLKSEQGPATAQGQMLDLGFDPTMGSAVGGVEGVDMELYLASDATGYTAYDQQQYPR